MSHRVGHPSQAGGPAQPPPEGESSASGGQALLLRRTGLDSPIRSGSGQLCWCMLEVAHDKHSLDRVSVTGKREATSRHDVN